MHQVGDIELQDRVNNHPPGPRPMGGANNTPPEPRAREETFRRRHIQYLAIGNSR